MVMRDRVAVARVTCSSDGFVGNTYRIDSIQEALEDFDEEEELLIDVDDAFVWVVDVDLSMQVGACV